MRRKPIHAPEPSGRFLLRLPAALHAQLQDGARTRHCSLNEYCIRLLAVPGSSWQTDDGARAVVEQSRLLLDASLAGVVLYGSVARGQSTATSDVDVLIVVDETVPLTRQIYRQWDLAPVAWRGRPVDPHFVRLPNPGHLSTGAWCEAAIDGVVLFERDSCVSCHLAAVRSAIASGQLVRRSVHGQPYWTEAA